MIITRFPVDIFRGYHRSGNGQGKNFFKVREKSGNFILGWGIDIWKKSQGTISTVFFHGEGKCFENLSRK